MLGKGRSKLLREILLEGASLGIAGSLLGIAAGYAMAATALHFFGGDLGAGYFSSDQPQVRFTPLAALVAGFTIFNFTVLLHEVIHQAVTARDQARPRLARVLSSLYAIPSGLRPSQFRRRQRGHAAGRGS